MGDGASASPLGAADGSLRELLGELHRDGYRFVTPSPATQARVVARPSRAVAADTRDVFGWSLPFAPDTLSPLLLALGQNAGILADAGDGRLSSMVRISWLDGELFVHSAYPTEAADSVFFGPDTYRFATAITAWLSSERRARIGRAVDIGAGAGPGGILVARACPQAKVWLVDINERALRLARINAALAGTANVVALHSDLLSAVPGQFDLIVSNPPYLNDPLRRAYRHGGGTFGAALSVRILDESLDRLTPGGTLLLYTGVAIVRGVDPFLQISAERIRKADVEWSYREVDPDVFGEELETPSYREAERIAAVVLTVTRKA